MSGLNARQKALYKFLLEKGDQWTHQIDVATALSEFYYFRKEKEKFHDSNARHTLTKDIRAISISDEIPKIIVSSGKGIKIANREEWEIYIKSEYKSVFNKLKRVRRKERKGCLDGQMQIYNRDAFIEAFLEAK